MGKLLHALFNGELTAAESIVPENPQYWPLEQKIAEETEALGAKLSEQDFALVKEVGNMCQQSASMSTYACFAYGFKLGVQLMCEVDGVKGPLER